MELLKIKKQIEKITKEAEREQIKAIKSAQELKHHDSTTECMGENLTNEEGRGVFVWQTLTEKQQTKTLKEQKNILIEKVKKDSEKKRAQALANIEKLESCEKFPHSIKIAINWHDSRTWGACPSAELWACCGGYYMSRSVGGCGYDKRSTAAAEVLESCDSLRALAFYQLNKKDNATIKKALKGGDLRGVFGYGLRFSLSGAVYFGAGCGMSAIIEELEHLGYLITFRHEPYNGADLYQFEAKKKLQKKGA